MTPSADKIAETGKLPKSEGFGEDAATTPAERALAEAAARRRLAGPVRRPTEVNGRDGPDPVRYGDWEVKGIATDF